MTEPRRVGAVAVEARYRDLLLHSRNFALLDVNVAIAERAAGLRAQYRLRTPDALQIAAALVNGCEAFLTNDIGLKRVTDLRILVLEELTL